MWASLAVIMEGFHSLGELEFFLGGAGYILFQFHCPTHAKFVSEDIYFVVNTVPLFICQFGL